MIGKGIFWEWSGKILTQTIGLIISIILTRLLSPESFGVIGVIMVFVSISQVFLDMGFGASLVQKKEINDNMINSVFTINLIIGLFLTLLFYVLAPIISDFFEIDKIGEYIEYMSIVLFIGSFGIVQNALLIRELKFKQNSVILFLSSLFSGVVGVVLANLNYEIWALVYFHISSVLFKVIFYFFFTKYRFRISIDLLEVKELWGFSSKKFLTQLIRVFLSRLDILLIGKLFTPSTLGFYSRANTLSNMITSYSGESVGKIIFPYISSKQDDIISIKTEVLKFIYIGSFLSVLISLILFQISDSLFVLLFSEEWIESAYYFKYIVISSGISIPLGTIMLNVILGLGKAATELKYMLIKRFIWILSLYVLYEYGMEIFMYVLVFNYLFQLFIDAYTLQLHLGISIYQQLKYMFLYIFISFLVIVIVNTVNVSIKNLALDVILNGFMVVAFYLSFSVLIAKKPIVLMYKYIKNGGK